MQRGCRWGWATLLAIIAWEAVGDILPSLAKMLN